MISPVPNNMLGRNFVRSLAFFVLGVIAALWFSSSCGKIPSINMGPLFQIDTIFQDTTTQIYWDTIPFRDTIFESEFGGIFYDTLFGGYRYDTIPYTAIPSPLDTSVVLRNYTVDITDDIIEGEISIVSASDVYDIKLKYTPLVPKIIEKTIIKKIKYRPLQHQVWGAIEVGPFIGVGADVFSKDNRYRLGYRYYYNPNDRGFHGISAGIKIFEL